MRAAKHGERRVEGGDKCPTVDAKTGDGWPPVATVPVAPVALPAPAAAAAPKPLGLNNVNFNYDQASLPPSARQPGEAVGSVKEWDDGKAEVAYNMGLSLYRAEVILDYRVGKESRRSPGGPDNKLEDGRFENRRGRIAAVQLRVARDT